MSVIVVIYLEVYGVRRVPFFITRHGYKLMVGLN